MNAHIDAHSSDRRLHPESLLVSALFAALLLAIASVGNLEIAAHLLVLVGSWLISVALLVGIAFGVVYGVASMNL